MNLPPESAVMRAEGGDGSLTQQEHLLRGINYRLEMLLYQNGGGKGKKPEPPKSPETRTQAREREKRLEARVRRAQCRRQQIEEKQKKE